LRERRLKLREERLAREGSEGGSGGRGGVGMSEEIRRIEGTS
jgi:hypothetical protein